MTRVIIVAAFPSARAELQEILEGQAGIAVVGTASGASDLERHIAEGPVDAVVFDHTEGETADVLATVARAGAALVVLGDPCQPIDELVAAGLAGWAYLLRDADAVEIAAALSAAAAGLVALAPSLVPSLSPAQRPGANHSPNSAETLTGREREVLQLMAQGLPNKQIGARLSISLHTVKFHVASILAKLGASSRTEAVTIGARQGHVVL